MNEKADVADFFTNAAVFAPLGFGLGRCGRRVWRDRHRVTVVVALATFVFGLAIETLQYLLLPDRYSSIVDVAGNTVGATLGAWWASRG